MTRSTDFGATVKRGVRAVQPDLVVHVRRDGDHDYARDNGPRVGLVVSKAVGSAVQRHRVARKLRHVARDLITDLDPSERIVIRALPGSLTTDSSGLSRQLRAGLRRTHDRMESAR
jgi:ribonuclease P protein component